PTPTLFPYTTLFRSPLVHIVPRPTPVEATENGGRASRPSLDRYSQPSSGIFSSISDPNFQEPSHQMSLNLRTYTRSPVFEVFEGDRKSTRLNSSHLV